MDIATLRIVIAPDAFKESLSAAAAARAIRDGMRRILPAAHYELVPMADGGEGTVDALVAATGGRRLQARVTGPHGRPVVATYGVLGDGRTVVIEMAAASGLALVQPAERDAAAATTRGTGELLRHALDHACEGPCERIIVGLGGSATNDGGAGFCQALGARFIDRAGRTIESPMTGARLADVARIDLSGLDRRLRAVSVEAACDVDNPLTGPHGASVTFGSQKGATPAQIARLDAALGTFYQHVTAAVGRDVTRTPGAGAAGGLGAALLAFLDAELTPGIELVMTAVELESRVRGAHLVVTGEGRIDRQTLRGKAPLGVARLARRLGVPVVAIGGSLADDAVVLLDGPLDALEAAVCRPMSGADAIGDARELLSRAGTRVAAWLRLAGRLPRAP